MNASSIESQLCVRCGMCCDGTLFNRAIVDEGEEARMKASGLQIFDQDGQSFFRLGCSHLSCSRCTIYETRFNICRTFDCALLRRVKDGSVGVIEAQKKVTIAKGLLANAIAIDASASTVDGRNELRAQLAETLAGCTKVSRAAVAQRLLTIVAAETYLTRWFRNKVDKSDPSLQAMENVGADR